MRLSYTRLARPKYICGNADEFSAPIHGLRQSGPFDRTRIPSQPRLLFVFPDELKTQANQLFLALKNGVGPFRGVESLLHFSMSTGSVDRVSSFTVSGLSDAEAARRYEEAIDSYLTTQKELPHCALVIHRKTERAELENPYLSSKYPLLKANVPTQVVTTDLMADPTTFQWSVGNIALALFAKMGGTPWIVGSGLTEDSLVVGINKVAIADKAGGTAKYYGFASTFSHDGIYRSTRLFPPANGWSRYLEGLRVSLTTAIEDWRVQIGTPVNLVLHVRKDMSNDETAILDECLSNSGENLVRSYSVVRLSESEHMALVDPKDETGSPPAGVMVRLAGHRALLQINGRDPGDLTLGKIASHPWHVTLLKQSSGAPPFRALCEHIMCLAAMNWRGFNAEAIPISVEYPRLVAELLGRFENAGFDVAELAGAPVLERVWFL